MGCNFREVEWDVFLCKLGMRLAGVPGPAPLRTEEELMLAINGLMEAIQGTIHTVVPKRHPSPYSKQWWSCKLTELKKRKNKLSNASYKYRALPARPPNP